MVRSFHHKVWVKSFNLTTIHRVSASFRQASWKASLRRDQSLILMPTFRFHCVTCGTTMTAGTDSTSGVAECPSCSQMVPVPRRTGLSGLPAECVPVCPPKALELQVKFLCTCCKNRLRADARLEGRSVPCPVCNEKTAVPRWSGARVFPLEVLELEVKFLCISCKSRLRADARLEGCSVGCPVCSEKIEVPRWSGLPDWSRAPEKNEPRPLRAGGTRAAVFLTTEEIDFLSEASPPHPGTVS